MTSETSLKENEKDFKILLYIFFIFLIISLFYYMICANEKKCSSENYGPDIIYTYGKDNMNLHTLIARVYNLNNEMIKKPLIEALVTISNDERIGVFSIDNPTVLRRPIESNESYHKILIPAIDDALRKRKLKLARNSYDNTVIYEPVTFDGYDYYIGQWLFVQNDDFIA